jgi:hypothetical protein
MCPCLAGHTLEMLHCGSLPSASPAAAVVQYMCCIAVHIAGIHIGQPSLLPLPQAAGWRPPGSRTHAPQRASDTTSVHGCRLRYGTQAHALQLLCHADTCGTMGSKGLLTLVGPLASWDSCHPNIMLAAHYHKRTKSQVNLPTPMSWHKILHQ